MLLPNGNPCRADCTYCGDAIVNGPPGTETCDDANADDRDSCRNTCLGRLGKDPGSIVFHGSQRPTDRLQIHGVAFSRLPVNTDGLVVVVRLSNAAGIIYETQLAGEK